METRTQQDYFESALELMADGGAKVVTIANLCDRLQVTKGSFYHHFESGPDFMQKLLVYWEEQYGQDLVRRALEIPDPWERIETLKVMAINNLHHDAESAIRALARTDPLAAEMQRRVDDERVRVVRRTLLEAGLPPKLAAQRARTGVAILIGMQQLERPVSRKHLRDVLDDYQAWLLTAMVVDVAV